MNPPNEREPRAPATSNGQGDPASNGHGVLSNLPRTRPQRSSARRTAARAATAAAAERGSANAEPGSAKAHNASTAKPRSVSSAKASGVKAIAKSAKDPKASKPRASASRARAPRPAVNTEPAPRQGFECESEHAANRAVHPPGGAELVASVAEILGELTKAGVATGERLLKDALSRLPLS